MKRSISYLKTSIATVVFLFSVTSLSYGANAQNIFSNAFDGQANGLQLIRSTPEPATLLLLGVGLLLLASVLRRGKKKSS